MCVCLSALYVLRDFADVLCWCGFACQHAALFRGAGLTAHAFVSRSGEKLDSSRALHPPSAARYFVGGIPPPCLACVRWRITRTVVAPFPCARSLHMCRLPDLPLWRVSFRSFCAPRLIVGSLNYLQPQHHAQTGLLQRFRGPRPLTLYQGQNFKANHFLMSPFSQSRKLKLTSGNQWSPQMFTKPT